MRCWFPNPCPSPSGPHLTRSIFCPIHRHHSHSQAHTGKGVGEREWRRCGDGIRPGVELESLANCRSESRSVESSIDILTGSSREVHLWYTIPDEVKDASLLRNYLDLLSPCERENVLSIREHKLQKCALLARTLVRTTLARYMDPMVNPRLLKFKKNKYGKPEVAWQYDEEWMSPPLHFNISHTSSLISCAIALNTSIGIDVEEKGRKLRNNILSLARRFFSSEEVNFLKSFSDPVKEHMEFIKLWTLKEAYVKALGRGISAAPFRSFSILSETTNSKDASKEAGFSDYDTIFTSGHTSEIYTTDWHFGLFELDHSHYAAICMQRNRRNSRDSAGMKLKAWKTIPLVEDKYVAGTDSIKNIRGLC